MIPPLHSIGRVAGKHGFSGEISIAFNRGIDPVNIKKGNFLFIEFDGKGVPFLIEQFKAGAGVVKLMDINDIREAEELEGRTVLVPGDEDASGEDQDILGFQIICNNTNIGHIISIESYPAGDMLILEKDGQEIMIPLVEDWIVEVDEENQCLVMDLPEGLLDL